MAQEICGVTKVTIKGEEFICDDFPTVWEVLDKHDYYISEENKSNLIRLLFIGGKFKYNDDLAFEIVW